MAVDYDFLWNSCGDIFPSLHSFQRKNGFNPLPKRRHQLKMILKDITKNIPWILLFIVTILFILFVCIRMSVTAHYFKYYIGEREFSFFGTTYKFGFEILASAFNTVGQAISLIGVLAVPWFTKLVGRKKAVIILFVVALVCTGSFFFLTPDNIALIFIIQAIGSLTGGPISTLLWVMYADTADYSEWKTGRRATGLVFSASIMSNKLGWAIGSMIAGLILASTGFVPNVLQNQDVLQGLVNYDEHNSCCCWCGSFSHFDFLLQTR